MTTPTRDIQNIDFQEGALLLVNKPKNWTSFDVCNKIRGTIRFQLQIKKKRYKVGHSGTLDPLADGLLQICIGKKTKLINELQGLGKEYTGTLQLGATTPSYDGESAIDATYPTDHINRESVIAVIQQFTGPIFQVPPIFSAIKIDGVAAYKLARRGESTEMKARPVTIDAFEITSWDFPNLSFRVSCSKGTYIRSLVHDFGKALGSGAYMTSLTRTKIGKHELRDAWEIEELVEEIKKISGGDINKTAPPTSQ